jgi:hypothetical protein
VKSEPARAPSAKVIPLDRHVEGNLRFIRDTMERASAFTAISGSGQVVAGLTALAASYFASRQSSPEGWLAVWLSEGVLAASISCVALVLKARRTGSSLRSGSGRKFVFNFLPAMFAGAALTAALVHSNLFQLLPGAWLLLFGTGVVTAGAFSVSVVPVMGISFMLLGGIALCLPLPLANGCLALGFGGLLPAFGVWIAFRHGG